MLVLPAAAYGSDTHIGRIYPENRADIFKNGNKVGEFRSEAPLPNGLLVSCRGKCTVKTDWLTLVADDGAKFSITTDQFRRELYIKEGSLIFVLSALRESDILRTPCLQAPLSPVQGNNKLKGKLVVSSVSTEISLLEGRPLAILRPQGEVRIKPGETAAFPCTGPVAVSESTDAPLSGVAGNSSHPAVSTGAAAAVIAIPVTAAILNQKEDQIISPFQP